ncbi:serine/threonine-protein phosphatase 7 long form-like protein [Senna tora]|uniref:Serine/threonine-protein phosphatase 7 long form-like protein n=1 Tax=Senna tora TaxID=362788 RepID=A0A834SDT2_9FABA|nr:serine/threonine-protein phosphatase 7 long form-like protein [Senna tora]
MPPRQEFPTGRLEGASSADIGWHFGEQVARNRNNAKCKLCDKESRELRLHRSCVVDDGLPPPIIVLYLFQVGFYGVSRVGHFEYNRPLFRALVEIWHPKTNTFHFPQGECIVTLQDVALQLGLPCSDFVVTRTDKHNYCVLCMELLGVELPQQCQTRKGQRQSMSWLNSHFQHRPDENSPEMTVMGSSIPSASAQHGGIGAKEPSMLE